MKRIILTLLCTTLLYPMSPSTAADITALPVAQDAGEPEAAPDLKPPEPGTRKGLMIAGWSTLGGGYLFSAMVGLLLMQGGDDDPTTKCLNCDKTGPYMLIPLVGPFIALPNADGTDGKVICGIMGAIQLVGLGMAIPGTIMFSKDREAYKDWQKKYGYGTRWYLAPTMAGVQHPAPGLTAGWVF